MVRVARTCERRTPDDDPSPCWSLPGAPVWLACLRRTQKDGVGSLEAGCVKAYAIENTPQPTRGCGRSYTTRLQVRRFRDNFTLVGHS